MAGPRTPLLVHKLGKAAVKHSFPLNYLLNPWDLGKQFYQAFKFGIVQFTILKTVSGLISVVLQCWNLYGEGEFRWDRGYIYIAVVINFSQSWALYCMIQFYTLTKEELAPIQPFAKFMCFKAIVFLTWWQGLIIAIVLALQSANLSDEETLEARIQDFIICIEMGFAACAHVYIFPAKPYQLMGSHKRGSVAVLSDYASIDTPPDPEEVKDVDRPTIRWLYHSDIQDVGTSLTKSMHDVVFKGGEYVLNDVKFTVQKVREPVEKGISCLNDSIHQLKANMYRHQKKSTKDDTWLSTIRGIDDPLLAGSISDSGVGRRPKKRYYHAYGSPDSSGESSDQGFGGYQAAGHRWTLKE